MTAAIEVLHYQTADGRIPFREWLDTVTNHVASAALRVRKDRPARGMSGDGDPDGAGGWEPTTHPAAGRAVIPSFAPFASSMR